MKAFILLCLLSLPAAAQTYIGIGATTGSNSDYYVGGVQVFGGARLVIGKAGELHVFGLLWHDSFGNRGKNAVGPVKPGLRANVRFYPAFNSPAWKPFIDAGVTTLRLSKDASHWPIIGGGVDFGVLKPRVHYLLGDGAGRPHAWRYGFDLVKPIGDTPFALCFTADGTKPRALPTVFIVSVGVAYNFK